MRGRRLRISPVISNFLVEGIIVGGIVDHYFILNLIIEGAVGIAKSSKVARLLSAVSMFRNCDNIGRVGARSRQAPR